MGLYYYRNRYYNSLLQGFISEDPLNLASLQVAVTDDTRSFVTHTFIQNGASGNLYSYVTNNPLNYTDPSGLIGLGESAALGAGLGAGTGWIGARKPVTAAAIAALFGTTYSPLIFAVPLYGPVGAVAGFVAGFSTGIAAAAVGDRNNVTGAIVAGFAGGIGGGFGGYFGGVRGAIAASTISTGLVITYIAYVSIN
jgi:RHS repeat-associated protein